MATRGIDFTRLSLRDALDLAALIEEEARDRYEELAAQMTVHHNNAAAQFFRFMAANEDKHRGQLLERRGQLFGAEPADVRREMLFDVEAPEYDQARASMSVRQAMVAALRSEEKAFAFFDTVLGQVSDPGVRELFTQLREEERTHRATVARELDRHPLDDGFDPADFEDEPVGHD